MGILERTGTIADEEIHDILRNSRRRATLKHLRETVGSASLRELSVRIAERESGESPPPTGLRESVYNSLHQTHLPKLHREGVVRYDRDRKTVELDDPAREVSLYMEVVGPYGITWASFYRTLCTFALIVVLVTELEVAGLDTISPVLPVTVFLIVLGIATSYQLWNRRWFVLRALAA